MQQFIDCPSWGNAGGLALDTISLLPIIPSVGYITHADDAARAINKGISLWPGPGSGRQVINGIEYTEHALERMAPKGLIQRGTELYSRGVPPPVVENAIQYGEKVLQNDGTIKHVYEGVTVITDEAGKKVITVW